MRRDVQRTDKGCTSGCESPRVTVTVYQEVTSYWDEAEALPFHSLVSDWENQRHTKRTQRQRVRLRSISSEKRREDIKRSLAKSLSMGQSQASGKDTPES